MKRLAGIFCLAVCAPLVWMGCIYKTRKFAGPGAGREAEFEGWIIRPEAIAFEGSSLQGIDRKHRFDCYGILTLVPEKSNNVARTSPYEARIVGMTVSVDGKTYQRANPDTAYGGNRDSLPIYILHMVEPPSRSEEFILIEPGVDSIAMKIKVDFRDPAKDQRIEKEFDFQMRRHEKSEFIPALLY